MLECLLKEFTSLIKMYDVTKIKSGGVENHVKTNIQSTFYRQFIVARYFGASHGCK